MSVPKGVRIVLLTGVVSSLMGGVLRAQNPSSADSSTTQAAIPLPPDVYPDSRNRLPAPKREDMDDNDKKIFDEVTRGKLLPNGEPPPGFLPTGTPEASVRLYSPKLAKAMSESSHYRKYETGLGNRVTEIAVLVTAYEMDNQYEWTQWERFGRNPNDPRHIDQSLIDTIKYDKPLAGLDEKDAAVISLGRELFGKRKVSPETFAVVLRLFGRRGTVDLVELMCAYCADGGELTAFDQQLQKGQMPLLPGGKIHAPKPVLGPETAVVPGVSPLPKDVYPDSRNRLPLPKRDDMDEEGKKIFDQLTRKSELPVGIEQASVRLYSPKLALYMGEAAHYRKYESGLPNRLLEIAVLTTAREMDSQYEWTQWETHGRDPNDPQFIEPAIIDTIKYNRPAEGLGEKETAIIKLGREMFGQRKVSSETFAEVLRLFGRRDTVDLVELMVAYSSDAGELVAFDQQLREGQKPLLPLAK
jgi:4-carboxymuconolactone decarboxylase